jgi:hypothetical protein
MKKTLSILFLGTALTLAACGKDKKAASDPAAAAPAADPAKPADPAAAAPAAPAAGGDQAKPDEKKGGW